MNRKWILLLVITLMLTGCSFEANPDGLMSAPTVGGVEGDVLTLLNNHLPENARLLTVDGSSVHYEDMDGDEDVEAIGFYYDIDDELPLKIVYFNLSEGEWRIQDTLGLAGTDFDEIYFEDLDHNGQKEMMLGINFMDNDEKGLIVYRDSNGGLKDLFRKQYVELIIADLDEDHMEDLILINSSRDTGIAKATLYNMIGTDLTYLSEVAMAPFVTYGEITVGQASEQLLGLFIEGTFDSKSALTELLIKQDNRLYNVFSDSLTGLTDVTMKTMPSPHKDVDDDNIIEISIQYPSIGYDKDDDSVWINQWYKWDGESGLIESIKSYDNELVDITFVYPENWGDEIKVIANVENEDDLYYAMSHHKRKGIEEILFSIHNVSAWLFQDMKAADGVFKITEKGNRVYLLKVEERNDSPYYMEADEILRQLEY